MNVNKAGYESHFVDIIVDKGQLVPNTFRERWLFGTALQLYALFEQEAPSNTKTAKMQRLLGDFLRFACKQVCIACD